MEKTELRIGNYILVNGEIQQISLGEEIDNPLNVDYEPILITPYILEKCQGFNYQKENNSWQLDLGVGLSFWGRDGVFNLYSQFDSCMGCDIIYLHQLQNSFHSLTGKELTITL